MSIPFTFFNTSPKRVQFTDYNAVNYNSKYSVLLTLFKHKLPFTVIESNSFWVKILCIELDF